MVTAWSQVLFCRLTLNRFVTGVRVPLAGAAPNDVHQHENGEWRINDEHHTPSWRIHDQSAFYLMWAWAGGVLEPHERDYLTRANRHFAAAGEETRAIEEPVLTREEITAFVDMSAAQRRDHIAMVQQYATALIENMMASCDSKRDVRGQAPGAAPAANTV